MKWDILKLRVKECSIRFGIKYAKQKKDEITQLESEINLLNKQLHLSDNVLLQREQMQLRLDELYADEAKGAQIRAKINEINEVETSTKFFKAMETSRQTKNVIDCLEKDDGNETSNQNNIL